MPTPHARSQILIGDDGLDRLRQKTVLIAGLGGVGGYCAEAVARAGVGQMIILDHDTVSPSNLNRQLLALHSTLGRKKTEVMRERLLDINPDLRIHRVHQFLADEPLVTLASANYSAVIDAIDTLSPKVFLIKIALEHGNRVISSMGAGARLDPTKITAGPFWAVEHCRLASTMRKRFRRIGFVEDFTAVYSTELATAQAVVHNESERNKKSSVGSISYITCIFGAMVAGEAIRAIIQR